MSGKLEKREIRTETSGHVVDTPSLREPCFTRSRVRDLWYLTVVAIPPKRVKPDEALYRKPSDEDGLNVWEIIGTFASRRKPKRYPKSGRSRMPGTELLYDSEYEYENG
jgi:hypothetical protein